jgi:hypothetical protein
MKDFTFMEEDLQMEIKGVVDARKFDDSSHGLSHCMKAVDFIVEHPNRYLFIEFKDPQDPSIPAQNQSQFVQNFQRGKIDEDLKYKYRDSFLYEWAAGRVDKPVDYLILIALDSLTVTELGTRTVELQRKLPLQMPKSGSWIRPLVRSCTVFNIAAWNRKFSDLTITRLSARRQAPATT